MPDSVTTKADSDPESAFAPSRPLDDAVALWLIRHGETEWSKAGRHTGRTDVPMTAEGEAQAAALRSMLANVHPALVLCSPLSRAISTAHLAGLTIDAVDDGLAEWDYGDYEGLTSAQIREQVPGWTVFTHPVPNGETLRDVTLRADRVLSRATASLVNGPVVLVAHGHICRVIGARWIGQPASFGGRLALSTAAPSVLGMQNGVPAIDRWNIPNPATVNGGSR